MIYLYSFIIGSCIGSFANVLIWRIPRQLNFVQGRSICTVCHHQLTWLDLLPIISWLALKGKCRYCKSDIAVRYPIVELISGLLAVCCIMHYDDVMEAVWVFLFLMLLLVIAWIDMDTLMIYDSLLLMLSILELALILCYGNITIVDRVIGSLLVAGPMMLLNIFIKDCFGGGDIKLMFVCGLLLGSKQTVLAISIALIFGGFGAMYLLLKKKVNRYSHMAFGPYLALGIAFALCYGTEMINWYGSLFN